MAESQKRKKEMEDAEKKAKKQFRNFDQLPPHKNPKKQIDDNGESDGNGKSQSDSSN